jgi:hypothetical protein
MVTNGHIRWYVGVILDGPQLVGHARRCSTRG